VGLPEHITLVFLAASSLRSSPLQVMQLQALYLAR
jgi:hypothetical protein